MNATDRRERFKRLATLRTKNVLKALKVLGNCSNLSAYEYSDKEIELIFSAIEKQLRTIKGKFQSIVQEKIEFKL